MASSRPPPHRALWEITWRCDLRCGHCLVEGGRRSPRGELDTAEAFDLIDQLADLGVAVVSLTGGEPLLRPDWVEIAARVRARGMTLRFASNGHHLDGAALEVLVELGTEAFAVSVDGLRGTHDRLRRGLPGGESSFDRVVLALERLRPSPIAAHVYTTVTRQNLGELPMVGQALASLGVDHWVLQLAHATGRLSGGCAEAEPLRPEELPRLADFVLRGASGGALVPAIHNTIGYLSSEEPLLRSSGRRRSLPLIWRGCRCGVDSIGVEPEGRVKGCANQVGEPFLVGDLREERLAEIWRDRGRWHWLDPAPEAMTGACEGCALAVVCQAGCTTLALRTTGELFNNPYCLRALERGR